MRRSAWVIAPVCMVICFAASWHLLAGPLTPPAGAPSSTGRFGPRIDVSTLPGSATAVHVISAPGSYYLSANVVGTGTLDGIMILAEDVTLDLNGFALLGAPTSDNGIDCVSGLGNIVVKNGTLSGWAAGINFIGVNGVLIRDVTFRACRSWGLNLVSSVGAHVESCTTFSCGLVFDSGGFLIGPSSTVTACAAYSNTGRGFTLENATTMEGCTSAFNSGAGVEILAGAGLIRGNCLASNLPNTVNTASSTLLHNHINP